MTGQETENVSRDRSGDRTPHMTGQETGKTPRIIRQEIGMTKFAKTEKREAWFNALCVLFCLHVGEHADNICDAG